MPSSRESRLAPVQGSFIILTPQSRVIKKKMDQLCFVQKFLPGSISSRRKGNVGLLLDVKMCLYIKQVVADTDLVISGER